LVPPPDLVMVLPSLLLMRLTMMMVATSWLDYDPVLDTEERTTDDWTTVLKCDPAPMMIPHPE
jgi:hypothetical protein